MKFSLNFPGSLPGLGNAVRSFATAVAKGWNVEHKPDGTHRFSATQTTVGAAGSATALPATPSAYYTVRYFDSNGIERVGVVPIYDPN